MSLGSRQNLSCWDSSGWGLCLNSSTDLLVTPGKSFNVSSHPSHVNVTTTTMSRTVLSWKPWQLYLKALQSTRMLAGLF